MDSDIVFVWEKMNAEGAEFKLAKHRLRASLWAPNGITQSPVRIYIQERGQGGLKAWFSASRFDITAETAELRSIYLRELIQVFREFDAPTTAWPHSLMAWAGVAGYALPSNPDPHPVEQAADETPAIGRTGAVAPPELLSLARADGISLWPYQIDAVAEIVSRQNLILQGPVGCGKTPIAIYSARIYMLRGIQRNAVALVPAPLVDQWADELVRFGVSPEKVVVIKASIGKRATARIAQIYSERGAGFFFVISAGLLSGRNKMIDAFLIFMRGSNFFLVVDEVANYKNYRTNRTKMIHQFVHSSHSSVGMSATLYERNPLDFAGILCFHKNLGNPYELLNRWEGREWIRIEETPWGSHEYYLNSGSLGEEWREMLGNYICQIKKSEVNLPEIFRVPHTFVAPQALDRFVQAFQQPIEIVYTNEHGITRTRQWQIPYPHQVWASSGMPGAVELLRSTFEASMNKYRRFVIHVEMAFDWETLLAMEAQAAAAVNYLERAADLAQQIAESGETLIVFCLWKSPLFAFQEKLEERNIRCKYVPAEAEDRRAQLEDFNSSQSVSVVLVTDWALKGINLPNVGHMLHLIPNFVPDNNAQREGRIRRRTTTGARYAHWIYATGSRRITQILQTVLSRQEEIVAALGERSGDSENNILTEEDFASTLCQQFQIELF